MSTESPRGSWSRFARIAVIVVGVLLTALLVLMMSWPPIREVITGETAEYPDVQPLVLRYSPHLVWQRAVEAVEGMEGWRVRDRNEGQGQITAEAELPVLGLPSQLTISVEPHGAGSLVRVSARSDFARGDFGINAGHIVAFQQALQDHLDLARPVD